MFICSVNALDMKLYAVSGGIRVSRKMIDGGGGGRVRQNAKTITDFLAMKWTLEISFRPLTLAEYMQVCGAFTNSLNPDSPAVSVTCSAFFDANNNTVSMFLSEFPAHSVVPGPNGQDRYAGLTLRLEEC